MHLLLVEDNHRIAANLKEGLGELGYSVSLAPCGADALALLQTDPIELIILDLGLPDMDGLEVLRAVRTVDAELPVLILTARDRVEDRVAGLDAGGDDYLVKPYAFAELAARIRAMERRGKRIERRDVTVGDLKMDLLARSVERAGRVIDLTPREFDLLYYMASRSGEAIPREMLARDVLGIATRSVAYDNVVDVHISNLRKKVDAGCNTKLLHTLRGVGFVLEDRS